MKKYKTDGNVVHAEGTKFLGLYSVVDLLNEATGKLDEYKTKAQKWDALFNSEKIEAIGSVGLKSEFKKVTLSFYNFHYEIENDLGQKLLNRYVNNIIKDAKNIEKRT